MAPARRPAAPLALTSSECQAPVSVSTTSGKAEECLAQAVKVVVKRAEAVSMSEESVFTVGSSVERALMELD